MSKLTITRIIGPIEEGGRREVNVAISIQHYRGSYGDRTVYLLCGGEYMNLQMLIKIHRTKYTHTYKYMMLSLGETGSPYIISYNYM